MELMIVDKNEWSKILNIHKAITRIGSAPGNDIQLDSDQISPIHLQIIYPSESPSSCKLTNLAGDVLIHTDLGDSLLTAYQTMDLRDGFEIEVGGYRLIPKLPLSAGTMQTSVNINAALSFPDPVLRPGTPMIGQLTITNQGDQDDCQFDVSLQGLPEECWRIDPIPLMYPGSQESIRIEIIHRGRSPQAGSHEMIFSITAPEHYPGDKLVIQQEFIVMPVYQQTLEIRDDVSDLDQAAEGLIGADKDQDIFPTVTSTGPVVAAEKPLPTPISAEVISSTQGRTQRSTEQVRDLSKMRVVKDQFDEFWEEE